MNIHRIASNRLAFETAKRISAILEDLDGKDVLLLLAGGSAFEVYNSISPQFLSDFVTVAMTDDRFSADMDINNTHLLQATDFYNECINNDVYFISTEVWGEETPEHLAERFEKGLRGWRKDFPKGVVVAVFGMGEDGHTCGIIPEADEKVFNERFDNPDKWVVGYTTMNNQYHERSTITLPFIRQYVEHAVVFVAGEKKREALDRLIASKGELNVTPARILRELKNVDIFTDINSGVDDVAQK